MAAPLATVKPEDYSDDADMLIDAAPSDFAPGTPPFSDCEIVSSEAADADPDVSGTSSRQCTTDLSAAAALLFHSTPDQGSIAEEQKRQLKRNWDDFAYGNYRAYYTYRHKIGETDDPRVQAMDKRWFNNRRCLDIGCNEGVVTLAMALKFLPSCMVGIDPDTVLIRKACRHLAIERAALGSAQDGARTPAAKLRWNQGRSLKSTWFQSADFLDYKFESGSFGTITCLSVTKWIHITRGDAALDRLFEKVKDLLVPGGFFILEPQPLKSYKTACAKLSKYGVKHVDPSTLKILPENFSAHLSETHGFTLLNEQKTPSPAKGFDRQLLCFKRS